MVAGVLVPSPGPELPLYDTLLSAAASPAQSQAPAMTIPATMLAQTPPPPSTPDWADPCPTGYEPWDATNETFPSSDTDRKRAASCAYETQPDTSCGEVVIVDQISDPERKQDPKGIASETTLTMAAKAGKPDYGPEACHVEVRKDTYPTAADTCLKVDTSGNPNPAYVPLLYQDLTVGNHDTSLSDARCELVTGRPNHGQCGYSPLSGMSAVALRPSSRSNDVALCYVHVYKWQYPTAYKQCDKSNKAPITPNPAETYYDAALLKGFIVENRYVVLDSETYTVPSGDTYTSYSVAWERCTLLSAQQCLRGDDIGNGKCRDVKPRTWDCDDGFTPGSTFNTCYQLEDAPDSDHPACQSGAPTVQLAGCADYVSNDYTKTRDGTTLECSSTASDQPLWTGKVPSNPASISDPNLVNNNIDINGSSNDYWCMYDAKWLNIDCHFNNKTTQQTNSCNASSQTAWCIKRASRTGGCDNIAQIILCRTLQAQYQDGSITADDVLEEGCWPCIMLPFKPLPENCPDFISELPENDDTKRYQATHNIAHKKPASIIEVCPDPPAGRIQWASWHQSGSAVVNSPAIIIVRDLPTVFKNKNNLPPHNSNVKTYAYVVDVNGNPHPHHRIDVTDLSFEYAMDPAGSRYPVNSQKPEDSVEVYRMFITSKGQPNDSFTELITGECIIREPVDFQLISQELWPDLPVHYNRIEALFGPDELNWWDNLTVADRKSRTEQRGLTWMGTGSTNASESARLAELPAHKVACYTKKGKDPWCRWEPEQSGYYSISVGGSWLLHKFGKRELELAEVDSGNRIRAFFEHMRNSSGDRDSNKTMLKNAGISKDDGSGNLIADPAAIGLTSTVDDFIKTWDGVQMRNDYNWNKVRNFTVDPKNSLVDPKEYCSPYADDPSGVYYHFLHTSCTLKDVDCSLVQGTKTKGIETNDEDGDSNTEELYEMTSKGWWCEMSTCQCRGWFATDDDRNTDIMYQITDEKYLCPAIIHKVKCGYDIYNDPYNLSSAETQNYTESDPIGIKVLSLPTRSTSLEQT